MCRRIPRFRWMRLTGMLLLSLTVLPIGLLVVERNTYAEPGSYTATLPWVSNAAHYSFFVCGHPRASTGSSPPGLYPEFVATFPRIKAHVPAFGVLTGDIVWSGTSTNWDAVDAELAQLGVPMHLAVGNHDMSNRPLFVSRYGPTYYTFATQEGPQDLFVVLDTELSSEGITGEQLASLRDTLAESNAQRAFVFMHKLLWVCADTPYEALYSKLNNPVAYNLQSNFWHDVVPLLRAFGKPVYVFAGDIGISWAIALFYQQDGNIRFIANGVGGSTEENYILVEVSAEAVRLAAYRLDGEPLTRGGLEAYDLAYYQGE